MKRKFNPWQKTECDICGCEYQVTRTQPLETDNCICNDCEIYNKAYKEGFDAGVESVIKFVEEKRKESIGEKEVFFDNVLKRQRRFLKLSLSEAAKQIGCTKAHLWEIEQGKSNNPSAKILNGIRRVYGLSAEFILDIFDRSTSTY